MIRARVLIFALGVVAAILLIGCDAIRFESKPSSSNPIRRGEELYNANCLVCHGGATGGFMMDYPPRHNANGHTWHHPDCQLTDVVLNGGGEMGEMMRSMMNIPDSVPRMPAWKDKLSQEDIAAILAFIKTFWTEDQRLFQASITRQQCKGA